jgi:hypothetical protein
MRKLEGPSVTVVSQLKVTRIKYKQESNNVKGPIPVERLVAKI